MKKILLPLSLVIGSFLASNTTANAQQVFELMGSNNPTQDGAYANDSLVFNTAGTDNHGYPFDSNDPWDELHAKLKMKNISGVSYDAKLNIISQSYPQNDTTKWGLVRACVGIFCSTYFQLDDIVMPDVPAGSTQDLIFYVAAPKNGVNGTGVIKASIETDYQTDTFYVIVNKNTTSIKKIEKNENKAFVYPNPATSGIVTVFADQELQAKTINVTNVLGATVSKIDNVNTEVVELDVNNYTPGVYIVNVIDKNGVVVATNKFTKN